MTATQDGAYVCKECGAGRSGAVRRWHLVDLRCAGDCGRVTQHLLSGVRANGTLGPRPGGDFREDDNRGGVELHPGVRAKELDKLRAVVAGLG